MGVAVDGSSADGVVPCATAAVDKMAQALAQQKTLSRCNMFIREPLGNY
jgi:hypothetical protein